MRRPLNSPAIDPARCKRRILLSVVGLSPQVVTETLYALVVTRDPPFVPTEIRLCTTREGRERALLTLLDGDDPAFRAFCRDYGRDGLARALRPEWIEVIPDPAGGTLADIVTPEDNAACADAVTASIRRLTADADAALHVSIAGGRKTMSFLAGYALSLFGREQDRLSHVLVAEPFQSHPQFFYPPPKPRVLFGPGSRPIRTDAAGVSLAEIPFVRLRTGLPHSLLDGRASFSETVRLAEEALQRPTLAVDLERKSFLMNGHAVTLPDTLFLWYSWFAMRRSRNLPVEGALNWREVRSEELVQFCQWAMPHADRTCETLRRTLRAGMTKEYFEEKKARVNRALRQSLGPLASRFALKPFGSRPLTRIGLDLPRSAIVITEPRARTA